MFWLIFVVVTYSSGTRLHPVEVNCTLWCGECQNVLTFQLQLQNSHRAHTFVTSFSSIRCSVLVFYVVRQHCFIVPQGSGPYKHLISSRVFFDSIIEFPMLSLCFGSQCTHGQFGKDVPIRIRFCFSKGRFLVGKWSFCCSVLVPWHIAIQTLNLPHVCNDSMIEFPMLSLGWDHSAQMTVRKGRTNLKFDCSSNGTF